MGLIEKITPGGQSYTYHYDGTGSTIAMTDSSGNIVNEYAYDEFGNIVGNSETVSNPFKYVGQYGVMDEGNGFYNMRARYYDPRIGRFISEDPIGLLGGINQFAYVGAKPVNMIDPLGLDRVTSILGTASLVSGTIGLVVPQAKVAAAIFSGAAIGYTMIEELSGNMSTQEAAQNYAIAEMDIVSNVLGYKGLVVGEALLSMISRPLGVTSTIKDILTTNWTKKECK